MNRFAAWSLGRRLEDSGPYTLIHGQKPIIIRPGVIRFSEFSIQDADYPNVTHYPRKVWSQFIDSKNLWLRDSYGNKIHGWGAPTNNRWIVDLSKDAPWEEIILQAVDSAITCNEVDNVHMDDLSIVMFNFAGTQGIYTKAQKQAYAANVQRIANALRGKGASVGGWQHYADPPEILECFSYVKMEGFRFAPLYVGTGNDTGWAGKPNNYKTWSTWWDGDIDKSGIRQLENMNLIPVIEAQYDSAWSQEIINDYAMLAVATACLSSSAYIAFHREYDWANPVWTPAHDLAIQLGEPTEIARKRTAGTWTRQFTNGKITINPKGYAVGGIKPYSASIQIG